jgi:hypothetical protein
MEKIRIRDKHSGSANTAIKYGTLVPVDAVRYGTEISNMIASVADPGPRPDFICDSEFIQKQNKSNSFDKNCFACIANRIFVRPV